MYVPGREEVLLEGGTGVELDGPPVLREMEVELEPPVGEIGPTSVLLLAPVE